MPVIEVGPAGGYLTGAEADQVSGALREIDTLWRLVADPPGPDEQRDVVEALDGLAKDLVEFGYPCDEVRDLAGRLLREIHRHDAVRRDDRDRSYRQAAQTCSTDVSG